MAIDAHSEAAINKKLVVAQAVIQQTGAPFTIRAGLQDKAKSTRISDDTIFHIFSMTSRFIGCSNDTVQEGKIFASSDKVYSGAGNKGL